MSRYAKPKANEWIRPIRNGYKMACCDCGLVHEIDFRAIKKGRGYGVKFQVRSNNRSTALMRRQNNIRVRTK